MLKTFVAPIVIVIVLILTAYALTFISDTTMQEAQISVLTGSVSVLIARSIFGRD